MSTKTFFNNISSYIAMNHPEIFMEAFNNTVEEDFSNLSIFNEKQSEWIRTKYGINAQGVLISIN